MDAAHRTPRRGTPMQPLIAAVAVAAAVATSVQAPRLTVYSRDLAFVRETRTLELGRGAVRADLSYLAGGISWGAEHTVVRSGETGATWSTNVRIENTSGVDFRDARLKLVAGEPRRVGGPVPAPMPMMRTMAAMDGA